MATGTWHYAEAERLTALATDADTPEYAAEYLQLAQVHALLAVAAAAALNDADGGMPGPDHIAWLDAAAVAGRKTRR